jgi:8-oxo-dGTP pyrophosphatase MutT (NUDIX family)
MNIEVETYPPPFSLAMVRESGQTRQHPAYLRRAVRAVVVKNGQYLMTFSETEGDYKFPGGGVQPGESHRLALKREILEETGYSLKQIKTLLGTCIELDFLKWAETSVFRMISFYYLCELSDGQVSLSLDPYENELGFTPRWVAPRDALQNNEVLIQQPGAQPLFWLARECAVLRVLIAAGVF